jgi:hypothetical protein
VDTDRHFFFSPHNRRFYDEKKTVNIRERESKKKKEKKPGAVFCYISVL